MSETRCAGDERRSAVGAGRWGRRRLAIAAFAVVALGHTLPVLPAQAQVAPSGSFHVGTGTGATGDPAVSPTGGYSASVPLDLPSPRGPLPVPLAVVYTGLSRAGGAGAGWDIPLSYVAWQQPERNRPRGSATAGEPPPRLILSIGGSQHRMVASVAPLRFVPFLADGYMDLSVWGEGWKLRTLDNLEYRFRPADQLGYGSANRELWLLTEIRDAVGGDRIVIEYDATALGTCDPDVRMKRLSYTFDGGGTPLYQIELTYDGWWRTTSSSSATQCASRWMPDGGESASIFDRSFDDQVETDRTTIATRIDVLARNNLEPGLEAKTIRSYHLRYDPDRDTDKPRLVEVRVVGEDGALSLPVASYEYGAVVGGGEPDEVTFGPMVAVPRSPVLPAGFENDIGDSVEWSDLLSSSGGANRARREFSATTHLIRDLTGDGLPDEAWKIGGTWHFVQGRLNATGLDLAGPVTTWSEPSDLFMQTTFRFVTPTVTQPWAREMAITTEVWSQLIDWNGDGRLDVLDARGGDDAHHWKVWINTPGISGVISWAPHQIEVAPIHAYLERQDLVSIADLVRPVFPAEGWFVQVPLSRSKSWPRVRSNDCAVRPCPDLPDTSTCGGWQECDDTIEYSLTVGSDTISEWSVADANQDGFPDVVAQTGPTRACDDLVDVYDRPREPPTHYQSDDLVYDRVTTPHSEDLYRGATCGGPLEDEEHGGTADGAAAFLNRHGAFYGESENVSPFADTPISWRYHEHAVGGSPDAPLTHGPFQYWGGYQYGVPSASMGIEDYSWQSTQFVDRWSEGGLRAWTNNAQRANVFTKDRSRACDIYANFTTAQVVGHADLNGDGLLDLVESPDGQRAGSTSWQEWQVRFNTGRGFGPAHPIRMTDANRFALSEVVEECSPNVEHDPSVVSGLQDLDADGLPEMVRLWGDTLMASSIVADGETGGAGRLVAIHNGYGARIAVHYANAKRDPATTHAVPFPEIVVSQVETTILDGSGAGLAPVYYRYGNARMVYDAMAARWTFPGYRWQLVLIGETSTKLGVTAVDGVLTRYEYADHAPTSPLFVQKAIAGRLVKITRAEGEFGLDNLHHVLAPGTTIPFAETSITYGVLKGPLTDEIDALLDCGADNAGEFAVLTDLCRATGFSFQSSIRTWEGTAPTVNNSTEAGARATQIDAWGRPTALHDEADRRRTDDDVCTAITYGDGTPFPSVVTSVTLTDCGLKTGVPITLAASRFLYDGLPFGQVGWGRLTARWIDLHDETGFLGSFQDEAYTYDAFGEISTAVSARAQGGASTRTVEFTRDAFGASIVGVAEIASDVGRTFTKTTRTSTWPSRGASSIDTNGIENKVEVDGLGRTTRESIASEGHRWTLRRLRYEQDGRRIVVETFPGNTALGTEDAAADRHRSTTVLDALGRARFTQTELGASYAQATIVSDLSTYDALGRVVFAAAPFESTDLGFTPESLPGLPYGTTVIYDRRGRVIRSVEAEGWNESALTTSVADRVYVAETRYQYSQGQAVIEHLGADEHDPTSPNYGAHDQSYLSAIGRETRRVRRAPTGETIDLVDQSIDRLGRVTTTTRYADPASMSGGSVWRSRYDSLGRRLRLEQPGASPVDATYDEDGNELEAVWVDSGRRRITRTAYDGFGRATERQRVSADSGLPEVVESRDLYYYDAPSQDHDQPVAPESRFLGRLAWIENPVVGKVYFGYDALGRGNAEAYAYAGHETVLKESVNTAGGTPERLTLTTPQTNDVIEYVYDSAGRARGVRRGSDDLFDATNVNALGQYLEVRYGNGVVEQFAYEPAGRREQRHWTAETSDGQYVFERVARDGAGRVTEERHTTPSSVARYLAGFDQLGRLTSRLQTGGITPGLELFAYDGLGNLQTRVSTTGSGNRLYTPSTADPDRLCRYAPPGGAGCLFKYDGAGNVADDLTQPDKRSFTYDAAQRILGIAKAGSDIKMTYGPIGRMKTEVAGPNARTVWRFGASIEEKVRPDGVTQIERSIAGPLGTFVSLRTTLDANGEPRSTEAVYAHGDGRANRLFTRAGGRVAQTATYASFGATTSNAGDGDPLAASDDLWNGGDDLPEVGLVILGPRAYDPEMGRFLQRDPISIVSRSTTGNPYAFSFGDPANYADPSGLSPRGWVSIGGAGWGGGGGGGGGGNFPTFGAIAATNFGYSAARQLLGADSGAEGPHAAVAVGASQWKAPTGLPLSMFIKPCGFSCQLNDIVSNPVDYWGETQAGMWKGGWDVVSGLGSAVKSIPGCIDPRAGCSVKMIVGIAESQRNMVTDPGGTFCEGGCAEGISRFVTRETVNVVGPKAGGAVWRTFSRSGLPRGAGTPSGSGAGPRAHTSVFEMKLDPTDIGKSRRVHANRANAALDAAMKSDPAFANLMEQIIPGVGKDIARVWGRTTPEGWVWHHVRMSQAAGIRGLMRLVPGVQHTPGSPFWGIMHPGGYGGYSEWAIPAGAPPN